MSSSYILCRLCVSYSEDVRELYDKDGQGNKYYLITMKYFGNQLINSGGLQHDETHSRAICGSCWNHMHNFNEFQLSVLSAQTNYDKLIKNEICIKSEMEIEFDVTTMIDTEIDEDLKDPVALDEAFDTKLTIGQNITGSPLTTNIKQDIAKRKSIRIKRPTRKITRQSKENIAKPTKKQMMPKNKKTMSKSDGVCVNTAKKKDRDAFIAEHMKKEFSCAICSHVCQNMTEIKNHFRKSHNTQGYVTCCNKKFYHRIHLVDHLNVHINSEYFKCDQCGKSSASRRSLAAHIKNSHSKQIRNFECLDCHRKFLRASCLRIHLETHATGNKDFVCEDCGKGFVLESRLKLHVKNVHARPYNRVCELCGKSVQGKLALRKHLLTHEGIAPEKWPCNQCDAQLVSKYSLGRHKKVAHSDGSTVYVCSICGKCAKTAEALRGHKRYAHQKRPNFECKICQKTFKVSLTLREHMSTHTGEDLYNCPHCTKTFRSSANMHHHRKRVHPTEWLEKHQQRLQTSKIDLSRVSNEVVL